MHSQMLVFSTYLSSIVARVYKVIRIWGLGRVMSLVVQVLQLFWCPNFLGEKHGFQTLNKHTSI